MALNHLSPRDRQSVSPGGTEELEVIASLWEEAQQRENQEKAQSRDGRKQTGESQAGKGTSGTSRSYPAADRQEILIGK